MPRRRASSVVTCPQCGAKFRFGRLACPDCGSDFETGWREGGETADWESVGFSDEDYADAVSGLPGGPASRPSLPSWARLLGIVIVAAMVLGLLGWGAMF